MQEELHKKMALNLLCVVCQRERDAKVVKILEEKKSFFNLAVMGMGTANPGILNYLGIGDTDKTAFFSLVPAHMAGEIMQKMDDSLHLKKPGHGIAFTMKINKGCYHKPVHFASQEQGADDMEQQTTHDLILVVLNRGYTEEVMDVARPAGATGGTVLHARGCGLAGAEKFFGVTIQPEKEMLMMVAKCEQTCSIMDAIAESAGPGTDSSAVSFSMPLSSVRGLSDV